MTPVLTAVPNNSLPASASEGQTPENKDAAPKYTTAEREAIRGYTAALSRGRYFLLFNAASPFPRLISGDNTEPLPLSFLSADFRDYCRESGHQLPAKPPADAYFATAMRSVTGTAFLPNGSDLIRARHSRHCYVNTYRSFEPQHPAIQLSNLFHEFVACLFPVTTERHTFLQYCGHMIQRPEERPSWHPMLLSETGTGKGFLYNDILRPLLCNQTFLAKRYGEILGKFSPVMEDSLLVLLDDCKSRREDTQTALKSLMTEEMVLLEKKGLQAGMVPTYARFFLASNEQVPLDLDDTERRWWVPKRLGYSNGLEAKAGRDDRQALIKHLSAWLKTDGALEAVHTYLATYSLEGFDSKNCPMTTTLQEQIDRSETEEQACAREFLEDHSLKVVKSSEMREAIKLAGMRNPSNNALPLLFAHGGYQQDTLTPTGKNPTRWWFPVTMEKAEATAILNAEQLKPAF
jgi:hypothetical protein